ncbi:MAG: hypothetical protein ABI833_22580 [Acidobacteriota bacterium]
MKTLRFALAVISICGIARVAPAQVVPPAQIKDPQLRALQSKHLDALTAAAAEIASHTYPSKFYLTRELDLRGSDLRTADQRSIEFTAMEKQTVLMLRGNYSATYPTTMPVESRVTRTYLDVVVPILSALMPAIRDEAEMNAVAIQVSDHVRKVAVMTIDRFENLSFVIPRATALKINQTSDPDQQLAALSDARVYADGRSITFDAPAKAPAAPIVSMNRPGGGNVVIIEPARPAVAAASAPAMEQRQTVLQPQLDRMVRELGPRGQLDPLHKPALFDFRGASYLRLQAVTPLAAANGGSQYRLAALAFDRHISHLIRSVLPYVKGALGFEGIAFRTTVSAGPSSMPDTVEFLFPVDELQRYENFDITGQQLINAGFVLINGERVGLDLQSAEAVRP